LSLEEEELDKVIRQSFNVGETSLEESLLRKRKVVLTDVLREDNYEGIIPSAHSLEEAITYFKGFYGTVEGRFTTFLKP